MKPTGTKWVSKSAASDFWSRADTYALAGKHGCYVFAMRAAKGFMPWYVGMASRPLCEESFAADKLNKYNEVLTDGHKGTPVLFFVVAEEATKNKLPIKVIDELETTLIQFAALRNNDLINVQKARRFDEWNINGVLRAGKGKPSTTAAQFKTMLRI
ncbi:MAG: hypothetical protein IT431_05910 [Phycisphaerales bacterium]|nr:hypothetical protein [Phycisphaerales bacterium]